MITCKKGVIWIWMRREILTLLLKAEEIFAELGLDCVVTSAADGKHKAGSLHYSGDAVDIRSKSLPKNKKQLVLQKLQAACGSDYDIILEYLGEDQEHFHAEFDPKSRRRRP